MTAVRMDLISRIEFVSHNQTIERPRFRILEIWNISISGSVSWRQNQSIPEIRKERGAADGNPEYICILYETYRYNNAQIGWDLLKWFDRPRAYRDRPGPTKSSDRHRKSGGR